MNLRKQGVKTRSRMHGSMSGWLRAAGLLSLLIAAAVSALCLGNAFYLSRQGQPRFVRPAYAFSAMGLVPWIVSGAVVLALRQRHSGPVTVKVGLVVLGISSLIMFALFIFLATWEEWFPIDDEQGSSVPSKGQKRQLGT